MTFLKNILSGSASTLVDAAFKGLDSVTTSKEELEKIKLENIQEINRHLESIYASANTELENILRDKQSARDMYKANSSLQKIYAITFLLAYVALSIILIMVSINRVSIPDYAIALISTIFGGMSTKVGTITDFLFGSSLGSKQKQESIERNSSL